MRPSRLFALFIFVLFLASAVPAKADASDPWADAYSNWQYRREITISNPNSYDLTDFQVKIILDSSNFDSWNKVNSDGSDIRFADQNGNPLSYWIEKWDYVNQEAMIWVKVPSIPANGETTIYMYYGNPNAESESDPNAVFDLYWTFDENQSFIRAATLENYVFQNYVNGSFFSDYPRIDNARGLLALIERYKATNNSDYYNKIIEVANHLVVQQNPDGSYTFPPTGKNEPLTADVVAIALIEAWKLTGNETYKLAAIKAINYTSTFEHDAGDGTYYSTDVGGNLVLNFMSWHAAAKMVVGKAIGDEAMVTRARQVMQYVLNHQNADGSWDYVVGDGQIKTIYQVFMDVSLRRYLLAEFDTTVFDALKRNVDYVTANLRDPNTKLLLPGDHYYAAHINFWYYIATSYIYTVTGDETYLRLSEETLNAAFFKHQIVSGRIVRVIDPSDDDHTDTMIGWFTLAYRTRVLGKEYTDIEVKYEKIKNGWQLVTSPTYSGGQSLNGPNGYDNILINTEQINGGIVIEGYVMDGNADCGSWPSLVIYYVKDGTSIGSFYRATITSSGDALYIQRIDAGTFNTLASTPISISSGVWYKMVFISDGKGNLKAQLYDTSGNLLAEVTVTDTTYTSGYLGVAKYRNSYFDSIRAYKYADQQPTYSILAEEKISYSIILHLKNDNGAGLSGVTIYLNGELLSTFNDGDAIVIQTTGTYTIRAEKDHHIYDETTVNVDGATTLYDAYLTLVEVPTPTIIYSPETVYIGTTITTSASAPSKTGYTWTYYYKIEDITDGVVLRDWSPTNIYTTTQENGGHTLRIWAKTCEDSYGVCSVETYVDVVVSNVANPNATITFYLYDADTFNELANVTLILYNTSKTINSGDKILLSKGNYTFTFSKEGYENRTLSIEITADITMSIYLAHFSNEEIDINQAVNMTELVQNITANLSIEPINSYAKAFLDSGGSFGDTVVNAIKGDQLMTLILPQGLIFIITIIVLWQTQSPLAGLGGTIITWAMFLTLLDEKPNLTNSGVTFALVVFLVAWTLWDLFYNYSRET